MDGTTSNISLAVGLIRTSGSGSVSVPASLTLASTQDLFVTPRTVATFVKDFGSSVSRTIVKYYLYSSDSISPDSPRSWTFEGSNDNINWTILDTQVLQTDPGVSSSMGPYAFNNSTSYRYYRLNVTSGNGTYIRISKMVLINAVISTATTLFTCVGQASLTLDVSNVTSIISVLPLGATSGAAKVYFAVSFDGGVNYNSYNGAWRKIARVSGGTWQYNTSATATPTWVSSLENNASRALHQAFGVSYNRMDVNTLASLDDSTWGETGGFNNSIHNNLDLAWGMAGDGNNIARLTGFTFYVTTGGGQTTLSFSTVKFSAPCQELSSLAVNGASAVSVGVLYYRNATADYIDGTVLVADDADSTYLELTSSAGGYDVTDSLYIGGVNPFGILRFGVIAANAVSSVMSVSIWNGVEWVAVETTDGTSYSGATLHYSGTVSWGIPSWWTKMPLTVGGVGVMGYWARIKVSVKLTNNVKIAYVRVVETPPLINKYRNTAQFNNCIVSRKYTFGPGHVSREFPL